MKKETYSFNPSFSERIFRTIFKLELANTSGCSYVKEQIINAGFRIIKSEDFKSTGQGSNLLFRRI